eukprot:TRINITY_DN82443_c0_g1_i1.p1 TRINITY_DN82443_c0_g1~~TRINITY_DN82443_c0_g1_i1.p1  ORF type:complete len:151 (+),score=4.08 TRINITY_DN82443_c0_g1_i1:47-454(+)
MGYNIGIRLIEDFLARSGVGRCSDFRETAEVISKVGFKMFLGVSPTVAKWSPDSKEFSLLIDENPLAEFVELPDNVRGDLFYSNILCGVIRGALEMVQMQVETSFVTCSLKGDERTEIRVRLMKFLDEEVPVEDD